MTKPTHLTALLALALIIAGGMGFWLAKMGSQSAVSGASDADTPRPAEPTQLLANEQLTIQLFERASPSVVNINTLDRQVDLYTRRVRERVRGSGSGFIWDKAGHVVTNYHVVRGANAAQVVLEDQSVLRAKLVGVSPDHDLAVLKVALDPGQAKPLPLGLSGQLAVGQSVFAIGNPFGLDHTLTSGIISALGREITSLSGQRIVDVVQTDAAINPGNSGGPLLDSGGRVVGVNTAIFSKSGGSHGIGFAVPIDTVRRVVPQLIKYGEYRRPELGVRSDDRISKRLLAQIGLNKGVLILGIVPNSGAAEAELVPTKRSASGRIIVGDIIRAVDGKQVNSLNDLRLAVDGKQAGDVVVCDIVRKGKLIMVEVKLR